ncbi:GntR family transcriptional regulator [Mucilaginibacter sp. Bleaf8]|uniref:GntR family transcriptional regulator n=1 Tax=Mucilaginibacter sp. Bleaf8 TaxID=2834430 RepID=UPI001BCF8235|nr:GntR family transcriptional regulator [Mucilaginibacter sp. Bleaf8]MBS7563935.1 GntR family transcriptional regulator [Mucilaginibacter sp. Bleaf8]
MPVPFLEYIFIDYHSSTPKYLQLANAIIEAVRNNKLSKNDTLPSINELNYNFELSRDTAEKAYKHLKATGILGSVPGKGYYIKNTESVPKYKVFLLFNKLSAHKKIIYDALVTGLNDQAAIDFYIYNNDFSLFKKFLENADEDYTHYVIIGHFIEGGEKAAEIINKLPKEKLILLDNLIGGIEGEYAAVYEDFEKDISGALEEALPQLSKYNTIKLAFPKGSYFPQDIVQGFLTFCTQYAFNYSIVNKLQTEAINSGEVFITLREDDVVTLVERILSETNLQVGQDVGVISYNETPLKKIILNGLTTISSDFQKMGEVTARCILNNQRVHEAIPFHLKLRSSL